MDIKGKTVLISGASSGIGAACAEVFAAAGCNLILFARRLERLTELKKNLLREHSVKIEIFQADVRDAESLKKNYEALPADLLPVQILINNAGLARGSEKFHEFDPRYFDEVLDTNVKGVINVTRLVLDDMIRNQDGHIINLGSIAGHQAYPGGHIYNASKFALRGLMDAIRIDTVDTDVRISSIDPGMVNTEFSTVRYYGDREKADEVYRGIDPLLARDIAEGILFIATRPPHVNINEMVIMPTHQATATIKHYQK